MNEQEIVNILKENKAKGIAFGFMPREVQQYITSNFKNLLFLNTENQWVETLERQRCWNNMIFALSEDFEMPPKSQGEWVEFKIDEDGFFCYAKNERHYLWFEWNNFLIGHNNYSIESNRHFIAFGGWKYRDCEAWYTTPQMFSDDHYVNVAFKGEDNIKPAVPVKIRFWRKI